MTEPRAFLNRCPTAAWPSSTTRRSNRLPSPVCPYRSWTYTLQGSCRPPPTNRASSPSNARTGRFRPALPRGWPLDLGRTTQAVTPLEQQLDLVHQRVADLWTQPLDQVRILQRTLHCNWKIAHDNTLDDYHVAVAHPTTLHREQGPVRDYAHHATALVNLLVTPHADGGCFHTFGLPPWLHLITWPDGRLALLEFLPLSLDSCCMQLWLFAPAQPAAKPRRMRQQRLAEGAAGLSGRGPGPGRIRPARLPQWTRARSTPWAGATDHPLAGDLPPGAARQRWPNPSADRPQPDHTIRSRHSHRNG